MEKDEHQEKTITKTTDYQDYNPLDFPYIETQKPVDYGLKNIKERNLFKTNYYVSETQEKLFSILGKITILIALMLVIGQIIDLFPLKIVHYGETGTLTVHTLQRKIISSNGDIISYKRKEMLGIVYYTVKISDTEIYNMNTKYPARHIYGLGQRDHLSGLALDIWDALILGETDYIYRNNRYYYTGTTLSISGLAQIFIPFLLLFPGFLSLFFPEHLSYFLRNFYAFWESPLRSTQYYRIIKEVGKVLLFWGCMAFFALYLQTII